MLKMNNTKKQSGFTLVEIAIVLVIVGLLLGGILRGQELVNSARVRNLANQNSNIQAAYFGFIDRYRQIPGDMTAVNAENAIGPAVAGIGGDGNSQINTDALTEPAALWSHLAGALFLQGSFGGDDAYAAQDDAPLNAFQGRVLLGQLNEYLDANVADGGAPANRLGFVFGQNVPVTIMLELDNKVDDGTPDTGVMRASSTGANDDSYGDVVLENGAAACTAAGVGDDAPLIWNIPGNEQNCNAVFIY